MHYRSNSHQEAGFEGTGGLDQGKDTLEVDSVRDMSMIDKTLG